MIRFLLQAVLVAAFFFPALPLKLADRPYPAPNSLFSNAQWGMAPAAFAANAPLERGEQEEQGESVRIASWSDGDTLRLADGRRLRLAGLDAPETEKPGQPAGHYATEALELARRLTSGVPVRILLVAGGKVERAQRSVAGRRAEPGAARGDVASHDRYGRLVAELFLPDGRSLNELLLREGMAFYYPHKGLPGELEKRFLKAQLEALDARKGAWRTVLHRPQARQAFTGNRRSHRFFSRDCLKGAKVNPENQVPFADLEAAFRAGYAPARQCGIWPDAE